MRGLLDIHRAQLKTSLAIEMQYRASLAIWLLGTILEPVIYLTVWATVAQSSGGEVGGYTASGFAAYFIVLMIVNHLTFSWIMWEYEYYIRQGLLSPLLLRPAHPIHKDLADNLAYKTLTLVILIPVTLMLIVLFRPTLDTSPWAVVAFVPALVLAFAVRWVFEWTLAMSAFWTTRISAVNQVYFAALLFFSGRIAPLDLMPPAIQTIAYFLPFRWMIYFPAELILGQVSPRDALIGFGAQIGWFLVGLALLRVVWRAGIRRYSGVGA